MHLNILNNSSIYMNQIEYIVYLEKKKIYLQYLYEICKNVYICSTHFWLNWNFHIALGQTAVM